MGGCRSVPPANPCSKCATSWRCRGRDSGIVCNSSRPCRRLTQAPRTPCCQNGAIGSRPGRRSPPSQPTAPSTPESVMARSPPAGPLRSSRKSAKPRKPDTPPALSPAPNSCGHLRKSAGPSGDDGAVIVAMPGRDTRRMRKRSGGSFSLRGDARFQVAGAALLRVPLRPSACRDRRASGGAHRLHRSRLPNHRGRAIRPFGERASPVGGRVSLGAVARF